MRTHWLLSLCVAALAIQLAAADVSFTIGDGNRADFVDLNGQIKVYPADQPTTFIKMKLVRLEEVNATGAVEQAVTNFATESFTWASPELRLIDGVNATAVAMRKTMNRQTNTTFGITALVFHKDADTPYGTGTVHVYSRAVKFTVEVEKWPFKSASNKLRLVAEVLHVGGEFFALFQVHAATLAGYRKAFSPSGAKDDPSDARIALDLLLRHPERLQALKPQSPSMRMLATLVEERRQVGDAIVRITNRLGSVLKLYYPQVLDWFEHRNTIIFCDFLTRWPTVMHARRARTTTLQAFFYAHRCGRKGLVVARIESIRSSTPLTEDTAIIRPALLTVQTLVAQLRVLIAAIDDFDEEIAGISKEVPDYELFASLPGAGHIQAPRLLVAFGEDRDRFIDAAQVQCYAGIAPVIERSGNRCWVHWRFACSTFLRQTFVEWAGSTVTRSAWAGAFYRQQRSKGASHGVA